MSERKQSILQSFEQPLTVEEEIHPNQPRYKFNEIKFASTGILFNLSQRFGGISSEINLPESLVYIFLSSFQQLVIDTIVDKREWQTDCYFDYKPKIYVTSPSGERRQESVPHLTRQGNKKVTLNINEKNMERPFTAKSTASGISIRSDTSHESSRDADYDKLPSELRTQGPQILQYRRETQAPHRKPSGPSTRLEKFQTMKQKAERAAEEKS